MAWIPERSFLFEKFFLTSIHIVTNDCKFSQFFVPVILQKKTMDLKRKNLQKQMIETDKSFTYNQIFSLVDWVFINQGVGLKSIDEMDLGNSISDVSAEEENSNGIWKGSLDEDGFEKVENIYSQAEDLMEIICVDAEEMVEYFEDNDSDELGTHYFFEIWILFEWDCIDEFVEIL